MSGYIPAPVNPESEGWYGTKHDPRIPMIEDAQSVVEILENLYTPEDPGEADGHPG